jgi:hypothetical protein
MDEMEKMRIDDEIESKKSGRGASGSNENRESGVEDVEVCKCVK